MDKINSNHIKVLNALLPSAQANGMDFGFTDECEDVPGLNRHQIACYIGHLSKKGYIEIHIQRVNDERTVHQFTFTALANTVLDTIPEGSESPWDSVYS